MLTFLTDFSSYADTVSDFSFFSALFCSFVSVKISGPSGVTARVCSAWAGFAVHRHDRPFIFQRFCLVRAEIQHRLDRETISGSDLFLCSGPAVIRYLRRFVHRRPIPWPV
jgi:hypothetical protein